MRTGRTQTVPIIVLVVALALGGSACRGQKPEPGARPDLTPTPAQTPTPAKVPALTPAQPPVPTSASTPAPAPQRIIAKGSLSLPRQVDLAFDISGRVADIAVKEGDKVIKGQPLARIADTGYQLAVKSAEVDLETAQRQLQTAKLAAEMADYTLTQSEYTSRAVWRDDGRVVTESTSLTNIALTDLPAVRLYLEQAANYLNDAQVLLSKGDTAAARNQIGEAQQDLALAQENSLGKRMQIPLDAKVNVLKAEQARAAVDTANSQVDKAKIALDKAKEEAQKSVLVAPFDGIITQVGVTEGKYVSTTTTICRLVDVSVLQMAAIVNELDIGAVRVGQKATISLEAFSTSQVRGTVSYISPVAALDSGVVSYRAIISLEPTQAIALRDGLTARADIIVE